MSLPERAVSSVVGTVLLIALAAVLATGVLAAGSAMNSLADPPPTIVVDAEEISAACAGCGPHDQVVRLTHQSGDAVSMADSTIVVSVPEREQTGRLVALPLALNCLRDSHVEGTDLFDGRCGRVAGAVTAVGTDSDGVWRAGESLSFRLRKSAVRLAAGDDVVVRLRHVPSGTVVSEVEPAVVG